MPIVVNLDVMLARRKMAAGELAERVGITPANLSILKNQNFSRLQVPDELRSHSAQGTAL